MLYLCIGLWEFQAPGKWILANPSDVRCVRTGRVEKAAAPPVTEISELFWAKR